MSPLGLTVYILVWTFMVASNLAVIYTVFGKEVDRAKRDGHDLV